VELENIGHKNLSVSVSINNLSQEKMIIAKTEKKMFPASVKHLDSNNMCTVVRINTSTVAEPTTVQLLESAGVRK
jgi:hypothetical protein